MAFSSTAPTSSPWRRSRPCAPTPARTTPTICRHSPALPWAPIEKVEDAIAAEHAAQQAAFRSYESDDSDGTGEYEPEPPSPEPIDPKLAAEHRRARVLLRLAHAVQERLLPNLERLAVLDALPVSGEGALSLSVAIDGQRYDLRLEDPTTGGPCFFRTEHFLVSYVKETPLTEPAHQRTVKSFIRAIDCVATRHAPYALPRGVQTAPAEH